MQTYAGKNISTITYNKKEEKIKQIKENKPRACKGKG